MPSCSAFNCTYRYNAKSEISVHRFPFSRPEILNKWIVNVRRANWYPSKMSVLCSSHFEENCFEKSGLTRLLKRDAVPTLFNFTPHLNKVYKKRNTVGKYATEPTTAMDRTQHIQSLEEHNYYKSSEKIKKVLEEKDKQNNLYKRKLKVKQQEIRLLCKKVHSLAELLDNFTNKK